MKSKNSYFFNMSLILLSVIIIIYLLYLNDKKILLIENFSQTNGYDYLVRTQGEGNLQKCMNNLYYIQCIIYSKDKDPFDSKKNLEFARYNLYFDKNSKKLRFGKITKDVKGIVTYKDTENDSNNYKLNNTGLINRKDFRFKVTKEKGQYKIIPHDNDSMVLTSLDQSYNFSDNIILLKQKKDGYEIDNYKIMYNFNNPLIVSFLDENQNINFNYDNDLLCEFYNTDYKKKLSNIINSDYQNEIELKTKYPTYDSIHLIDYFNKKKNIGRKSTNEYCPVSHPYPFDTILSSVVIDDDDNIDFEINFNNQCCSTIPGFNLKGKGLKDKVSNDELADNELEKIQTYIKNNNFNLFNNCPSNNIKKDLSKKKNYSILNIKEDEKTILNDNLQPVDIKNLDKIITDKSLYSKEYSEKNSKNDLPFQINQRTLFEFKCITGKSGIDTQGATGMEGGVFTSSDSSGSTTGDVLNI